MTLVTELAADLLDETAALRAMLVDLDDAAWHAVTPATPWRVLDQVAHLAAFDERQRLAVAAPAGFAALVADEVGEGIDVVELVRGEVAHLTPAEVLAWFDRIRPEMVEALLAAPDGTRIAWYGPPMGVASALTARLMETWAHGVDVADTVGVALASTDRLRHVAQLAHRAIPFAFAAHRTPLPDEGIAFELEVPGGSTLLVGELSARARVSGPLLDLCLLAVQRRAIEDLDLRADGAAAAAWCQVAQAFAGPPGAKRRPRSVP